MVVSRIARQAAAVIGAVGLTVPILTAPGSAASATGTPGLALASSADHHDHGPRVPDDHHRARPHDHAPRVHDDHHHGSPVHDHHHPAPPYDHHPAPGHDDRHYRSPVHDHHHHGSPVHDDHHHPPPQPGYRCSVRAGGRAGGQADQTRRRAGAPPANPTAILTAVQADLSQVSAIQQYARARSAVNSSRQGVAAATAGVERATAAERQARARERHAQANVAQAATRVRQLALAAYMGLGYVTPAAGPVSDQPSGDGTVSTPGGLTGSAALDALTLVQVVAVHERKDLVASHSALARAARTVQAATAGTASAQADLAGAEMKLSASQQTLSLMTRAATTPGLAATLDLPSPSSPPTTAAPRRAGPVVRRRSRPPGTSNPTPVRPWPARRPSWATLSSARRRWPDGSPAPGKRPTSPCPWPS